LGLYAQITGLPQTFTRLQKGLARQFRRIEIRGQVFSRKFSWFSFLLFFASNIIFGLSGIANKPAILQRQFIFLDGFIDAAIIVITAVIVWALIQRTEGKKTRRTFGKIPALVSLFVGIGGQALFATL
jgi:hypothetical protein